MKIEKMKPSRMFSWTAGILLIGIILLIGSLVLSLMYGSSTIGIHTLFNALFHFNSDLKEHQIIREIRLPRALTAAMIGAFLSLSGAVMQSLTRNPLAEPSLIGVSYGAAFALVISFAIFPGLSGGSQLIFSMVGAGLAVMLVLLFARGAKGSLTPVKLALAGVAIGMLLSSLTSVIAIHFNVAKELSFWYAGRLAGSDWSGVKLLGFAGAVGVVLIVLIARALTLLNFGEEVSKGLGVNLRFVMVIGILAVLLLTGSSVAVSGTISFVGLVVPHISRMMMGSDYRYSLPISAVLGSLLLVLGDVGSRFINPPYETPIGVITAAIGVPFFLYLVRSGRSRLS